jgi:hypothetical protein
VKKATIVVGTVLAVVVGVAVEPSVALAWRSGGGVVSGGGRAFAGPGGRAFVGPGGRAMVGVGGRGFVAGGGRAVVVGTGRGPVAPGFVHRPAHPIFPHRPFVRPFFPFGVGVVAAAPFYSSPYYYPPDYPPYYQQSYYDPPVSYSAPAAYGAQPSGTIAVAPAPPQSPPAPTVVEFATGRYELRGDGVNAPYTWVWIPNAPTAPPAAPSAPPVDPSSGSSQVPPRVGHLYRWTDAQGVIYWTDRLDAVPEQYRSRVKAASAS